MSDNSLASILAWMKSGTRMSGWGLVVALERRKTNLIVLQEYITRFSENSYLPPIKGEVPLTDNKTKMLIHDYVMDVPVLSFENADSNDSRAMLTMSVMGGSQLTLEMTGEHWKAYIVDEIDPLQGPKLHLDLLLNQVPGDVDEDGRVILDLSKSDNFRLTFAVSAHDQRQGGEFFRDLFRKLPVEQRIYTLGKIERGTNPLMRPHSFLLRTQASGDAARDPKSAEFGDGAVIALVRMEGRREDGIPTGRYLIPDDQGQDYSATVLFDRRRTLAQIMLYEIEQLIGSSDFSFTYQDGELVTATSMSGAMVVSALDFTQPVILPSGDQAIVRTEIESFTFPADSQYPLGIEFADSQFLVNWNTSTTAKCLFTSEGQEPKSELLRCDMILRAGYEAFDEGVDGLSLRQTNFGLLPVLYFVGSDGEKLVVDDDKDNDFWNLVMLLLPPIISAFVFHGVITTEIAKAFRQMLKPEASVTDAIQEILKLNFGHAIQGNEIYAPHDVGFFGRINPQSTSFLINPVKPLLKAGGTQQFTISPTVSGVQWKVENLVEGPGNPGTINSSSGVYQAPAASTIKGRFIRARVTATAPDTGYYSSALVTVVVNDLSVHPLIQVCDVTASVEMSAGALEQGQLKWSIKNPVQGESGEVRPSADSKLDHAYHHGPVVSGKTYVIDEIEVKNLSTGASRIVHVLALQKMPLLVIRIDRIDAQKGEVQLTALFDEIPDQVNWSLPLGGPGSIDSSGLYRADATATERFVLIFADMPLGSRKLEGHLILPLPLVEIPQLLEVVSK